MYIINTTSIGMCYSTRKEQSQILILSALAKNFKAVSTSYTILASPETEVTRYSKLFQLRVIVSRFCLAKNVKFHKIGNSIRSRPLY